MLILALTSWASSAQEFAGSCAGTGLEKMKWGGEWLAGTLGPFFLWEFSGVGAFAISQFQFLRVQKIFCLKEVTTVFELSSIQIPAWFIAWLISFPDSPVQQPKLLASLRYSLFFMPPHPCCCFCEILYTFTHFLKNSLSDSNIQITWIPHLYFVTFFFF